MKALVLLAAPFVFVAVISSAVASGLYTVQIERLPEMGYSSQVVSAPLSAPTGALVAPIAQPQPVVQPQVTVMAAAMPIPPQPTVVMPAPGIAYVFGLGSVMLADVGTMVLPDGVVQTPEDGHAVERHGLEEVNEVRAFMAAFIAAHPIFGQQPPCKDGRHRFVAEMRPGVWAVWVMEKIGDNLFNEKTAFKSYGQSYVNSIGDDCGNGSWWGHSYAR